MIAEAQPVLAQGTAAIAMTAGLTRGQALGPPFFYISAAAKNRTTNPRIIPPSTSEYRGWSCPARSIFRTSGNIRQKKVTVAKPSASRLKR